jgi:hypothetical protein
MKKMILATALVFAGAIAAVEVLPNDAKLSSCERIGEVKAGDAFATLDRDTAIASVKAQAKEKEANKIFLDVTSVNHGKLGKQYIAKAVAWKCN